MVQGKSYFAKNCTTDILLELMNEYTSGKKNYKRMFKEFMLWLRCFILGHKETKDIWRNGENPNWREEKDFEYHVGCRRCPKFEIQKP